MDDVGLQWVTAVIFHKARRLSTQGYTTRSGLYDAAPPPVHDVDGIGTLGALHDLAENSSPPRS